MIQDYYSSYLFLREKGEKDVSIGNSEQTPKWNNTFNSIKYHQRYNTIIPQLFFKRVLKKSCHVMSCPSVGWLVTQTIQMRKTANSDVFLHSFHSHAFSCPVVYS